MNESQIRILHVDDDQALLELTADFLKREDDRLTVETTTSVDEGIVQIKHNPPDCVVSDYDMPEKDGLEFLRTVREIRPELPFILFTGKGSESVASDAMAAGVTDYLQKDTGTEQYELLANRVVNSVKARRAAQEAARQEELMRLTEFAGDTGGWELELETEQFRVTEGARRLLGLSSDESPTIEQVLDMYHPDDRGEFRDALTQVAETRDDAQGTWRIRTTVGEQRLLDVTITPARSNGQVTALRGAMHDITEQRERRQELEQLIKTVPDCVVKLDHEGEFVFANERTEAVFGLEPAEVTGRMYNDPSWDLRDPEGNPIPDEQLPFRRVQNTGEPVYGQRLDLECPDGTRKLLLINGAPLFDENGTFEGAVFSLTDATEIRKSKRELELERQFIDQSLNALEDLFCVLETDGTIRRWNERVVDVTGYTESELDGMAATELFPECEQRKIGRSIEQTLESGRKTVEARVQTSGGDRIPYEWTGTRLTDPNGETTGVVVVGRNLSERRQRERRFRALVEQSSDSISVVDEEGQFQYQSPSVEHILGYTPDEILGDSAWEYIHPDDRGAVRETFERWKQSSAANEVSEIEYRARDADGSWRWLEAHVTEQLDNPAVDGYVINSRDITARKEREQQLRKTRDLMASMEQLADVGAWEYNCATEELMITAGGKRIYGIDPDAELTLAEAFELSRPEDRERLKGRFETCRETGEPYEIDIRFSTETGEQRWVTTRGERVQYDGGETVVRGYTQDITERKRRSQELARRNTRLEEFTSVVSHDLRNPLQVAEGRLELAQTECDSDHLTEIADAIDRSQALIDDLLTIARTGDMVGSIEAVSVATQVEECWKVVPSDDATLTIESDQTIRADPSQLQQLLENLVANAIEHGGTDVTVSVGGVTDGFYVADDGTGIPEQKRDSVFEAGYSTAQGGTGFGLRIVRQIADAHGWEVEITDSHSGGTRVEVTGVDICREL